MILITILIVQIEGSMMDQNSLSRYKEILSISEENIIFVKNPYITHQAELGFDSSSRSWVVNFNITQSEFPFIHELGHIYFAKIKTRYMHFALPPPPHLELNRRIGDLMGNLLDCFVNYNLSVFKEIYPIIQQNDFEYLDNLRQFQTKIGSINDLNTLLGWYILFYLDFRFILKKEDRDIKNQEIYSFLEILRSQIYNFTDFNRNNMIKLTKSLNKFEKAKIEIQHVRIIYFIYNTLLSIKLWSKEELKKQIEIFFP